ncbi:hypothetical protein AKJ40_02060 [candidate division MSBL1 archaeon SCGC-AAA259M10]|uniref:Branched-chain amino acid ABC transporter permease n=1 Tax=candidate division MSBL1 archaeon SCGC-AAA259M10 TaxID=1698270 RepID=A0A133V0R6_9EURY|nr:hypothetical protein AKJ40_02060 [candidate division MSBL1 archaeon SCGC-AAA259M10]
MIYYIVQGILVGTFYAVLALGLQMVFGVMEVVNFAHGDLMVMGGMIGWLLITTYSLPVGLIFPVVFASMFITGLVVFRVLFKRVRNVPVVQSLLIAFGLGFIIRDAVRYLFSPKIRTIRLWPGSVSFAGVSFSNDLFLTGLVCGSILVIMLVFLERTNWGKGIRATSEHTDLAQACGINIDRVQMLGSGIGIGLAGIGGIFLGVNFQINPYVGMEFLFKSFAVVVLGGMGSMRGVIIGGLIIGLVESIGTLFIGPQPAAAASFITIILVLLIRPTGFFGREVKL